MGWSEVILRCGAPDLRRIELYVLNARCSIHTFHSASRPGTLRNVQLRRNNF